MPYTTTIQIEPSTERSLEAKKPGFYTCIRYASKLIKLGTDIRKHRTLPTKDTMKVIPQSLETINEKQKSNYNYEEEETVITLYNEKAEYAPTVKDCNNNYSTRVESQLALPSRLRYVVTNNSRPLDIVHQLYNNEDEEEYEEKATTYYPPSSTYNLEENAHALTLQKLSGISFTSTNNKQSTAILIRLSPCALAAANAARQRRQKTRVKL